MTFSPADKFAVTKPVIAMVHFPGLPGRPRHDRAAGRARLLDVVGRDLAVLQDAGVDGLLFCNEADIPYQLAVGPEIPAAMAAVIGELRPQIRVPFGVNILWDARASLALARATGASFIREVLTGVYESDLGMIAPAIGDLAAYRDAIGAGDVMSSGLTWSSTASTWSTWTPPQRKPKTRRPGSGWPAPISACTSTRPSPASPRTHQADHHSPFTAETSATGIIEAGRVLAALDAAGAADVALILEIIPPFEQDDDQVLDAARWKAALSSIPLSPTPGRLVSPSSRCAWVLISSDHSAPAASCRHVFAEDLPPCHA